MKSKLVLFALALTLSMPAFSQNTSLESKKFKDNYVLSIGGMAATKNKGWETGALVFDAGYHINSRLVVFARVAGILHLYDKDDVKTYTRGCNLGGGLSLSLLDPVHSPTAVDFRLSVTNSVGNADWKNTTYGAELILSQNKPNHRIVPYLGLGYEYSNSHTSGIPDYRGMTGVFGIRF
ncbi:MAG: hypothetical protein PUF37_00555 [Prevotellaceae bacterium]|nr:hypothetical protein [Prevotellaceae bacterium]